MAASDILDKIESNNEIENIVTVKGRRLWPLLRQKIVFQEVKKTIGLDNKLRTRNKKQLAKNFVSGFKNFFKLKSFQFVFFNNTDKRILQNQVYFDIFFDAWADKLSQEKCLFIEWAKNKHFKNSETHSKNVVSDLPFKLITAVVARFMNVKIQNERLLDDVVSNYNLTLHAKKEIRNKLAELCVFKFFFKIVKPKAIFVLSSFTKVGIVMAAKELGIKVFEAQHGYIGDNHTFYTVTKQFKEAYPDTLFSFGTYEKLNANPKLIFSPKQITPIGSFQLELIKNEPINEELLKRVAPYTHVFCVTLQTIKEKEILDWVLQEAMLHPTWLFIIRAKNQDEVYADYTKQENIIECNNATIYEVLKISDFNITIYSTTAVEGMFLDAKPIFFNINNLSKNHFDITKMNAIVIENGEKLNHEILKTPMIKERSFFVENYLQNVENANLF